MPPASRSRSITVTGPSPSWRIQIAAASPAGPPPITATPSPMRPAPRCSEHCGDRIAARIRKRRGHLGGAEEALAAAHQRAGPAPYPVEVGRRDRAPHRVVELPLGDPLAE